MSKSEILAELPNLKASDLADIQAKLDEVAGDTWLDDGQLDEAHETSLQAALADYQQFPDAGTQWTKAKARIKAKLRA